MNWFRNLEALAIQGQRLINKRHSYKNEFARVISYSMKYAFFLFLVSLIGQSCSIPEDQLTAERAKAFYDVYSSRQHFGKFLDYYADSVVIEDMINGDRIVGKKAVSVFFDWSNPAFQLNGTKALVVTEMII